MSLYFVLLIRNVDVKEAMKFSAEYGSYSPGLISTRVYNPVLPIAETAASNWSNLPALKMRHGAWYKLLRAVGGISSSSVLGWAPLDADAAAGGDESSQGMGAEVVLARLAVVWERELKRPWCEEEEGWQSSEALRVWGATCLSSFKNKDKKMKS